MSAAKTGAATKSQRVWVTIPAVVLVLCAVAFAVGYVATSVVGSNALLFTDISWVMSPVAVVAALALVAVTARQAWAQMNDLT